MTTTHQPEPALAKPYTLDPLRSPCPGREPLLRALRLWQSPETEKQAKLRTRGGLCLFLESAAGLDLSDYAAAEVILIKCFRHHTFPFNLGTKLTSGGYWDESDSGTCHLNPLRQSFVTEAIAILEAELTQEKEAKA